MKLKPFQETDSSFLVRAAPEPTRGEVFARVCARAGHDWQLRGVTTATDGYTCRRCLARVEVLADARPPR